MSSSELVPFRQKHNGMMRTPLRADDGLSVAIT